MCRCSNGRNLFALILRIAESQYYSDKVCVHADYALPGLPEVWEANLELSQLPSYKAAENQMRHDVDE